MWSRLIGNNFGVFYQGWTRALIIVLVLLPILLIRREMVTIKRSDWKWLSIFLFFTSLTQAPLYYAFNNMDIGSATLLFFSSMLFTMTFFGFIFFKEKVTSIKIISIIIACIGLYCTFSFVYAAFALLAGLMAILNGIASGGEVASSKTLTENYSPLYITALSWFIILITNAPISILMGEVQYLPSWDIVWLYQLGYVFCGLIGFWSVIAGLKYLDASIGGLIGLCEIIFSIILGIIIFHEIPNIQTIIGGLLIIVAAALPHVSDLIKVRAMNKQHN